MNANGSGKTVLTHHFLTEANPALVNDSEPDWSPNGTEIAFTRSRQAPNAAAPTTGIEVMNADGSGQTRLTHGAKNDHSPVWSPDGKKIAFVRDLKPGARQYGEIYVMNANGSGQRRLTQVVLVRRRRRRRSRACLVAGRDEDRLYGRAGQLPLQRRDLRDERQRFGQDAPDRQRPERRWSFPTCLVTGRDEDHLHGCELFTTPTTSRCT